MGTMITSLDHLNPVRIQVPRLGRQRQILILPATAGADRVPGADARERPIPACTARPSAPADQDAVDYGPRPGDRRSAADLRLRLAEGVVVPFLPCRCSHVGAQCRIGVRE